MLFNLVQKFSAAADAKEMKHKKKSSCIYFSCARSHYGCMSSDIAGRFAFNHQVDPGLTSYFWFSTCSCFNLAFPKRGGEKKKKKKPTTHTHTHLYKLENGACQEQNLSHEFCCHVQACVGSLRPSIPECILQLYRDFEPETIRCFVLVLFLGHFF